MWVTDTTISKIEPVFITTEIESEDFVSVNEYEVYNVNTLTATPVYLFKIEFIPLFESNLFANINANTRIVEITSNSQIYEDASIETLNNTRQFISPLNFYHKNTLETIYLFTPTVEDVYLEVQYELNNMSTIRDIYPFIANDNILNDLQLKTSFESTYQRITKEFLVGLTITPSTSIKVHLKYKLIDSMGAVTTVFNNRLNISRKNVNVYEHSIDNWADIDVIKTESGQEYYKNNFFTNLDKTGFIINSSYIYQVL